MLSGVLSLATGIVGIFVPLLPTTPFLLLAAGCFAKSSEPLHQWLLNHHYFGQFIRDWQTHGAIPRKVKWTATLSMLIMVSYPLFFMIESLNIRLSVIMCISLVMAFIWSRPEIRT